MCFCIIALCLRAFAVKMEFCRTCLGKLAPIDQGPAHFGVQLPMPT